MRKIIFRLFLVLITGSLYGQVSKITVNNAEDGMKLIVDGQDYLIRKRQTIQDILHNQEMVELPIKVTEEATI